MTELVLGDSLEQLIDHRGKTPLKLGSSFVDDGVPVASAVLVRNGRLVLEEARCVNEVTFRRWMPVPAKRSDVVLTSEAPLGRVALVSSDDPLVLGQRLFGLRGKEGVLDSRYLFYVLQTDRVQSALRGLATGTTVLGIRQSALRQVRIPAPEFNVQRAIADVLGALDDKIAANERVARKALELGDALFVAGMESDGTRTTIGELADRGVLEFGDGYRTKRSEHGQPGLRILRAGDVREFQVFPDGDDFVSNDYLSQIGSKASRPGDVIMTTKGTVGRVAVVPPKVDEVVYSPQICYFRVREHERLDGGYLAAWFRSADLESQTSSLMYKSDMAPYINLRDIRSLSLPLPDSGELRRQGIMQRGLLDRFDACCVENERLARTRDELLPLLMSGKIGVKDAETAVGEAL